MIDLWLPLKKKLAGLGLGLEMSIAKMSQPQKEK